MGALDFLFQGTAPKSTTNYGQTTNNIPQWMSDYTQGLIAKANALAATPYQTYGGPRVAGFTQDQDASFGAVDSLQGKYLPQVAGAMDMAQQAGQTSPLAQAAPYLNQSSDLTNQAIAPGQGGLAAATPYITRASGTFTDPNTVQSYMNPYISNVINQAGVQAGQAFSNNILPQIQDTFVKAGQYGSSNMQKVIGQQVNQAQQGLQAQALAALAGGYNTAGQNFQADQSRIAGLGSLTGSLGSQQQGALLSAAQQQGALGSAQGQLAAAQGQLGLAGAQQVGALANTGQTLALQQAAAQQANGSTQQGLNQTNLNTAYQDFLNQQQYPFQMTGYLQSMIEGIPYSQTQQTQQTSQISPYMYGQSPLTQLATSGTALGGLQALLNKGG